MASTLSPSIQAEFISEHYIGIWQLPARNRVPVAGRMNVVHEAGLFQGRLGTTAKKISRLTLAF